MFLHVQGQFIGTIDLESILKEGAIHLVLTAFLTAKLPFVCSSALNSTDFPPDVISMSRVLEPSTEGNPTGEIGLWEVILVLW